MSITFNPETSRLGLMRYWATLDGYHCPYCKVGVLEFDKLKLTNFCPKCGGEVITDREWQRRRAQICDQEASHG